MTDQLKTEWNQFLDGKWTKDPPIEVGRYHIADRNGVDCGNGLLVIQLEGAPHYVIAGRRSPSPDIIWKGFFWSVPVPDCPPVPPELIRS